MYLGERDADGTACVVVVEDGRREPLPYMAFFSRHGLDYGALSAGSMDLARSILADHFGRIPEAWLYSAFLYSVIHRLDPRAPWTISGAEIVAWLTGVDVQDRLEGT